MSTLSDSLLILARDISARPQMFATTPEVAHGLIEALAWVILHEATGAPLAKCTRDCHALIKQATVDVYKSRVITPLLCDEVFFPKRVSSFDSFRVHSKRLIEAIEERLSIVGGSDPQS